VEEREGAGDGDELGELEGFSVHIDLEDFDLLFDLDLLDNFDFEDFLSLFFFLLLLPFCSPPFCNFLSLVETSPLSSVLEDFEDADLEEDGDLEVPQPPFPPFPLLL
jgi:hypothetical protein